MTPQQQSIVRRTLADSITFAGGQVALGKRWGVAQSVISKWFNGECRIAPERAREIERREKGRVTKAQLRPDLWG